MLAYAALLVLSVLMFLYGFFPVPNPAEKVPNDPPKRIGNVSVKPEQLYRPHFDKTVLVIIDALRWDFATPSLMPLTLGHMNTKGCISEVSVESPTVTLPRIKALTTGIIPQYLDLIRNLASSETLGDSWLHSARNKALKVVFYGDNTWEKLFPKFFARSEGTTSFFVWDFTEVDDNVTRNVNLELERADWDIMILHYLGLDHIGHVLGPFSSQVPSKLKEMDDVIDSIHKTTNDTLILITGDHGMRDAGGHGGTTRPEVIVPLIALGLDCENSSFLQTDIPVNLAVLLGLNIPSTSIGNVQRGFLSSLNMPQYLYALKYNTEMLLKKSEVCREGFEEAVGLHEKFLLSGNASHAEGAMRLYAECAERITEELYQASSKLDMWLLVLVVLVLTNLLILLLVNLSLLVQGVELIIYFSVLLTQAYSELHLAKGLLLVILGLVKAKPILSAAKSLRNEGALPVFLVIMCLVHPLTFISTSFIEEEHYFWIYCSSTLIFLLLLKALRTKETTLVNPIPKIFKCSLALSTLNLALILALIRFSMDLNSTLENSVQNDDNWANILTAEPHRALRQAFFAFSLVLVFLSGPRNALNAITLLCIFTVKSLPYHSPILGRVAWILICLNGQQFWVMGAALLIKPHNTILIPIALFTANEVYRHFKGPRTLTIVSYMLANCFYFLQGHRNSLASVDISIGYTGLTDYYPELVIPQVLGHTYVFPVLFKLALFKEVGDKVLVWRTLLVLRTSVVLFTSVVTLIFRHHLFIWSVFAPKLIIESVHTGFLFIEMCIWYLYNSVIKFFLP